MYTFQFFTVPLIQYMYSPCQVEDAFDILYMYIGSHVVCMSYTCICVYVREWQKIRAKCIVCQKNSHERGEEGVDRAVLARLSV